MQYVSPDMISLFALKIIAALSILAVGILGGIIPLLAARLRASQRFFSLGNALAGGIFLGVGFTHLLPEAGEMLAEFTDYPLAPLLAAAGIAILLWIDRVYFESMGPADGEESGEQRRPLYPMIMLAALSIHSVITGIALGLEPEVAASLLVMTGILAHKGSASFALMVSAHAAGLNAPNLRLILAVFVLMTPLGILFGTTVSSLMQGESAELVEGVFNALAAGTFIYIAIMDVIGGEMGRIEDRMARLVSSALVVSDDVDMPVRDRDRPLKFLLVLIGLGSMAVLGIWV
ncbi:MAG: hypothetical protein F4Z20_06140 [Gammaproteobacteria bacterium]|nr:hypothetical protein [Gammaproteobacteria bacterium]